MTVNKELLDKIVDTVLSKKPIQKNKKRKAANTTKDTPPKKKKK